MSEKEKKYNRTYQAKGLSAPPEWWAEVEEGRKAMHLGRSAFIRVAVSEYLKKSIGESVERMPAVA